MISRDEDRRATVRAIHLAESLRLDGILDEPVYQSVPAISDFIQSLPNNGAAPSERTEAWVMFDRTNIYVAARCWDSAPPERWIVNEMRRDQLFQNETFGVLFDTFYDRRNGYLFYAKSARRAITRTHLSCACRRSGIRCGAETSSGPPRGSVLRLFARRK